MKNRSLDFQIQNRDRDVLKNRAIGLWNWIARDWFAFIVLIVFATIAIYPIATAMNTHIIGWPGDNIQYVYLVGRIAKAVFSGHSPFVDPNLNYPDELLLAATDIPFLGIILMAPLTVLTSPTFTYNLLIFLSFLLSGYFTYLWIHRLTNSRFAGLVAGSIFLLIPYRVVHSYGHLAFVSTQFIPLFFWSLDHTLQSEPPSIRKFAWLSIATFLMCAMAQYYMVICTITGVVYALLMAPRPDYWWNHGWKYLLSMGSAVLVSSLPYLTTLGDSLYRPYNIKDTRVWSASLTDFFVPSRLHPIWGAWIEQAYPRPTWIEHTLYLGVIAGILAVIALIWSRSLYRRRNYVWLGAALFGSIMALGTDLHLYNGEPLQAENPIWLPAYYLGQLPLLRFMRVWARFAIVPMFFLALLAGIGAATFKERFNFGLPFKLIILALVFIDMAPGRIEVSPLEPRAIDIWLAEQPGDFAVAFLPAGVENYQAMYGSLFHEKMLPAYNHPTHLPSAFLNFSSSTGSFPSESALDVLRNNDLRYIILSKANYDGNNYPAWQDVEDALAGVQDLQRIIEIGGYVVYEFKSEP